jgi:hypothetical protein
MIRHTTAWALATLAAFLGGGTVAASSASIAAARATGPILVDGVLDEPAWAGAAVIQDLAQQDPRPGEPTAFRTEVRILIDSKNLYLGFRCFDPEPGRIAVHAMQRDAALDGDDHVAIALDTFLDNRTGYVFRINAGGARQDGLIYGPGSESSNWDGIWEGRARRTPEGWTAEVALPAKTFRFTPGAAAWGFNVQRVVPRSRLTLRWEGVSLDAAFIDMQRCGRLSGFEEFRQGLGLSLSPYGLFRHEWNRDGDGNADEGDAGLDVTYNLTPSLTGVLTINTDFAETDADAQQINLTRFPLFYPEKRAFFLEGANMFNFGSGLGNSFVPFFSRRVGLFEGQRIPILAGAKVLGRAGRWGIGFLDAYTDELEPSGDVPAVPRTNLATGRVTYDASDHLRVGAIFTDGDPSGAADNSLAGADVLWQTSTLFGSRNFSAGGWYAKSFGDLSAGDPAGYGFKVDYPNDLWDIAATFKRFGDALDPKLGFLPRPGTRQYDTYVAFQPRPQGGPFGWVRQFFFEFEPSLVENLDGVVESWRIFTAPFNARTQTGEHLEANWAPQFERLLEPFEVSDGVVIPAGDYHFTRYRVEAQSSEHRPWTTGGTVWFGEFFTGHLTQAVAYAGYTTRTGRHQVELVSENDYGYLPEGDFTERLHQLRWTCSFDPDLVLSLFTQYQVASGNVGWNARLRWTLKPGNDFYVVWNRNWIRTSEDSGERFVRDGDQFIVKLRWTFRK